MAMTSTFLRTASAVTSRRLASVPSRPLVPSSLPTSAPPHRYAHTVRIILTDDLPDGRGYSGDILHVKAGYARNFLIPKKKALYAKPANFERLGMTDPDLETLEEKRAREAAEAAAAEDEEGAEDLRAADLLRHYLRNKVLKIWRNVDTATGAVHPGHVDADNIRMKLSKQLRIDLEGHERVEIRALPVPSHADVDEKAMDELMREIGKPKEANVDGDGDGDSEEQKVAIRQLGEFVAKITLKGDHVVPLKFSVSKR